jgi:DNA-binding CsgD family transcriptional regulator
MFNAAAPLSVTEDERHELERLVRNGNCPQKVALRCKVVLLANEGVANASIGDQLKISRPTVRALGAVFA